jgi:hypothetical protein
MIQERKLVPEPWTVIVAMVVPWRSNIVEVLPPDARGGFV